MDGTESTGRIARPDFWSCLQSVGGPSEGSQATPALSLCPPEIEHIMGKDIYNNILMLILSPCYHIKVNKQMNILLC